MSQETVDSQRKPKEIKDSYEEQSLSNGSGRIRVEIPVDEGFDRDAYSKVTVVSSQPSQNTQTSNPSQSSRLSDTPYQSLFKSSAPRPFIWDEDEEGEEVDRVPITPDSQFLPGSSSYVPSETQASYTGVSTQPDTGKKSDLATTSSLERTSAAAVVNSTGSSYRHSEPLSHPSRTSNSDNSKLTSSQADGSGRVALPAPQRLSTFADRSQNSYILQASSNIEPLRDSISPRDPRSLPATSNSAVSTDLPTSSENRLPSPAPRSQSPDREATPDLSQEQSHQPPYSVSDEASIQFQTQVPLTTQDEASSQTPSHHVSQR